jgi:hypothetical protein
LSLLRGSESGKEIADFFVSLTKTSHDVMLRLDDILNCIFSSSAADSPPENIFIYSAAFRSRTDWLTDVRDAQLTNNYEPRSSAASLAIKLSKQHLFYRKQA